MTGSPRPSGQMTAAPPPRDLSPAGRWYALIVIGTVGAVAFMAAQWFVDVLRHVEFAILGIR